MAAKSERPLKKVTLRLYEDQVDRAATLFPKTPFNLLVRLLLERELKNKQAEVDERLRRSNNS